MYKKSVTILPSPIDGQGVFTKEDIEKDDIVWIFEPGHDLAISENKFDALSQEEKKQIKRIGYLSPWSGNWIFPPENDAARFTNHSKNNNLTAVYNEKFFKEPFFVANRKISDGEELTNNYYEFDSITQKEKPEFTK